MSIAFRLYFFQWPVLISIKQGRGQVTKALRTARDPRQKSPTQNNGRLDLYTTLDGKVRKP